MMTRFGSFEIRFRLIIFIEASDEEVQ